MRKGTDNTYREPQADDKYWKDKKGKLHLISKMTPQYAEACIWHCKYKTHIPIEQVPKALFEVWKTRHSAFIAENIKDLDA